MRKVTSLGIIGKLCQLSFIRVIDKGLEVGNEIPGK